MSYKEDSEEKTDSEDLVDVEYAEPDPTVVDNSETIERVLAKRRGKKGGELNLFSKLFIFIQKAV